MKRNGVIMCSIFWIFQIEGMLHTQKICRLPRMQQVTLRSLSDDANCNSAFKVMMHQELRELFPTKETINISGFGLHSLDGIQCMNEERREHITTIIASRNYLRLLEYKILRWFPNLKVLDLSHNQILRLNGIEEAPGLTTLHLGYNALSELPKTIKFLQELQVLDCKVNRITSLPPELGALGKLRILLAAYNRLQELPSELAECPLLKHVDVRGNSIASLSEELELLSEIIERDNTIN